MFGDSFPKQYTVNLLVLSDHQADRVREKQDAQ